MKYLSLVFALLLFSCSNSSDKSLDSYDKNIIISTSDDIKIAHVEEADIAAGVDFSYSGNEAYRVIKINEKYIVIVADKDWKWQDIYEKDIRVNSEGWNEVLLMDNQMLVVKGGNFFQLFSKDNQKEGCIATRVLPYYATGYGYVVDKLGVESVSCSSFLTQEIKGQKIEYNSTDMNILLFDDLLGISTYWNESHVPWSEGVSGNGEGEYLNITFIDPSDHMLVLNGYVDPVRKYLFLQNNRVKRARITSLDSKAPFDFEFEFNDVVEFSNIKFPCKTKSVRLTILEVYQGSKWDDTVISAVIRKHKWEHDEKMIIGLLSIITPEREYHYQEK